MFSEEEKKEMKAAVQHVLREVEAEIMEGKRQSVTQEEVAERAMRRVDAKLNSRPH